MSRLLATTFLTTLASLSFAGAAHAFTVSPGPATDTDFNILLTSGQIQEVFVPTGRGADNNSANAVYEQQLFKPLQVNFPVGGGPGTLGTQPIDTQTNRTWRNGANNTFRVVYNPNAPVGTPKVTFSITGLPSGTGTTPLTTTLTSDNFTTSVTELFLRTRAGGGSTNGAYTSSLSNLVLNGTVLSQTLTSSCTRAGTNCSDIDYLRISGLSGGFTLEGTSTFSWAGTAIPNGSNMVFQIKAAAPGPRANNPAPAPGMIAGIALAGVGSLWKKLKGKRQAEG